MKKQIAKEGNQKAPPGAKMFLREWREFRGFKTQNDLAEVCGMTRATVSRLENGKLPFHQWHLARLSSALQCEMGELLSVNPWETSTLLMIYAQLSPTEKKDALKAVIKVRKVKLSKN